jgi:hypothetical protein
MTWSILKRPGVATLACLLAFALSGCASGLTGPVPPVRDPSNAGSVTFYRDGSLLGGLWAPIHVKLDGRELVRIAPNERYTFTLDSGEYILDFSIGFNVCRHAVLVYPGGVYRYRLVPNCMMVQDLTWE